MDSLPEIGKVAAGGGGMLALIFVLTKAGLFKLQIGKNGNGYEHRIVDLEGHAQVANEEMKSIKDDMRETKKEVSEIRQSMGRVEGKIDTLIQLKK